MLIGTHRVQADCMREALIRQLGKVLIDKRGHARLVSRIELAIDFERLSHNRAAGVLSHLHACRIDLWESVKNALRQLVEIAWTTVRSEIGFAARPPPIERLAADFKRNAQFAEQLPGPRAGGNDQSVGGVRVAV